MRERIFQEAQTFRKRATPEHLEAGVAELLPIYEAQEAEAKPTREFRRIDGVLRYVDAEGPGEPSAPEEGGPAA